MLPGFQSVHTNNIIFINPLNVVAVTDEGNNSRIEMIGQDSGYVVQGSPKQVAEKLGAALKQLCGR